MEWILIGVLLVIAAMMIAVVGLLLILAVRTMTAAPRRKSTRSAASGSRGSRGEDDDITQVTLGVLDATAPLEEDDEQPEPPLLGSGTRTVPIYSDDGAEVDEPTFNAPVILTSAVARTDRGLRRKKNEDSFLVVESASLYVVADGMGGYAGGEVASRTAVDAIEEAFRTRTFDAPAYGNVPRRASELAQAVQMANLAIHGHAQMVPALKGMGTTLVAARFAPGKGRVYVGHVGDSRCYRLRDGQLAQLTTDHTLAATGVQGPQAEWLCQALGVDPVLKIDMVIGTPQVGDVYLLCSDGLTKMSPTEGIRRVLTDQTDPGMAAQELVRLAINGGGRDNITVVVIRVETPNDKEARSSSAA